MFHFFISKLTERYYEFMHTWGTHIAISVDFGALFGYEFEMKSKDVQKLTDSGYNI